MNSVALREQRAALVTDSRKLVDRADTEGRELTGEEEAEWSKRMADVDQLEAQIKATEKREKLEALEGEMRSSTGRKTTPSSQSPVSRTHTRSERNKSLKAWMSHGALLNGVSYTGDVLQRCNELGYNLHNNSISIRSMNTSSGGAGGSGTFTTTYPDLQTELKYFSPILDKVDLQITSDGNNFAFPRGSDVANVMAIVGQTSSSGTSTDPTFDKVTLSSYYFRYIELVTYEMLEDAVFDVEAWLTGRLAERGARTLEKYIVSGTGSSQPTGITAAAVAADSGTAAVILGSGVKVITSFDSLYDLIKAVDPAYRPGNTLVFHDSTLWDLRKIKDSDGRYIWDLNNQLVQNAVPDKIGGWNYMVSNSMDASNVFSKNPVVFADLSRHCVRVVDGIRVTRLNELYRASGMIGFEVVLRFDCNYLGHPSSIARLATPAS